MEYTFKGTPGNWVIRSCEFATRLGIDIQNGRTIIVFGTENDMEGIHGGTKDECIANAHLIAAAPDLLEALLAVKKHFPSDILSDQMGEEYNLIDAAINKALNL